jgi:hypothetical protein
MDPEKSTLYFPETSVRHKYNKNIACEDLSRVRNTHKEIQCLTIAILLLILVGSFMGTRL